MDGSVTSTERTIYSRIREAAELAEQPDPNVIADLVLADMSAEELHHYALNGVKAYASTYLARQRPPLPATSNGKPSSARWDAVRADQQRGELDLARFAVYTGKSRKWLLDCTATDLFDAAEFHREAGDRLHERAEQYTKLANHLKRQKGAEVVGELVESKVAGVLSA